MLAKTPALKETEDTSLFSIAENLNKYMLEHIWNKKKKSTSIATDAHIIHWFRNILVHHVFYM